MKGYKSFQIFAAFIIVMLVGFWGCWYDMDEENAPSHPDSTGVQGWAINMTITPSTAPCNGSATLHVQVKFWNLEDRSPVINQGIYLSIYDLSYGGPASPFQVHFTDGSIATQVVTNELGLADITMHVGYLPETVPEKNYYIRGEATIDFDNTAVNIWDTHSFRLYNPYWDGKPTQIPEPTTTLPDTNLPTAEFTFFPMEADLDDTITFDGSLSYDVDRNGNNDYSQIASYQWFFGDGSAPKYGKVVTHSYTDCPGVGGNYYQVELVVYDDEGKPAVITKDGPILRPCGQ